MRYNIRTKKPRANGIRTIYKRNNMCGSITSTQTFLMDRYFLTDHQGPRKLPRI
uniref:Uncharacterized protein n=1 Tax=Setaria italica TaxID=4555 RepID=K3YBM2_SETIT